MSQSESPVVALRELLSTQLAIPWSLADRFVLPSLNEEVAHWEPSSNVCAVHNRADGRWSVDFPDESALPLPDVTAAWLLWHITWWWTNAERWTQHQDALSPSAMPWAGSVTAAVSEIRGLNMQWSRLLSVHPMDATTGAPFPTGQSFAGLASWVNVELTKSIAELGQLTHLHQNAS